MALATISTYKSMSRRRQATPFCQQLLGDKISLVVLIFHIFSIPIFYYQLNNGKRE